MNAPSDGYLSAPLERDTDLLALHSAWPERYPFLLESADGCGRIARYDLLLMASDEFLSLSPRQELHSNVHGLTESPGFLDALNNWQSRESVPVTDSHLPFIGGWFLYLGYELAAEIEPRLVLPSAQSELPNALAVRCPAAIIRDKRNAQSWLIAENAEVLHQLRSDAETHLPRDEAERQASGRVRLVEDAPEAYTQAVERIKEYILAGDVFQVNLSRSWQGVIEGEISTPQLYADLRRANPAPFAGLMHWAGSTVLSSSPERLVEVRGRQVQTRPIAGTRPRSRQEQADDPERQALMAHPKERAEHIMLIDLERNDLGRICESGSVLVDELMVLESYAHVHHIVSNVSGKLRKDVSAGDVIRAVFPGGTITGCPKVRCMEIIAELEQNGRGYYTGAMGYLDRRGNMDLNILIRCLERQGNHLAFRTGAGIVADSVAENELLETRAKARGILRAINNHDH